MAGDLDARVLAYIRQHHLIACGETVVVAVSGGADSLCLLHVLLALRPTLQGALHVAHLDHALRPAAGADAAFVAAHAAALGVPCTVERRDVAALARERRLSLETAAREARYAFLRQVAAQIGTAAIATGHTRDDQAETVLLHLARGSGLHGLRGMQPRRGDVIRPLLDVERAATVAYCAALGLQPREDETNYTQGPTRNRLRHQVLPILDQLYPAASANIARAARLLAADHDLLERLARRALDDAVTSWAAARVAFSLDRWRASEPALRPHMLRLLLEHLRGSAAGFEEQHIAALLDALDAPQPPARLTLPHGLALTCQGGEAMLGEPAAPLPPLATYRLPVPGVVATAAGTISAERVTAPAEWSSVPARVAYLAPAATGAILCVRAWRSGDRLQPLGLVGTRKLQDVFTDAKIPRAERQRIPVVEGPRGIAWVGGLCSAEPYRVAPGEAAVRVTWHEPSTRGSKERHGGPPLSLPRAREGSPDV